MTTCSRCVVEIGAGKACAAIRSIKTRPGRNRSKGIPPRDWRAERFSRDCTSHQLVRKRGRSAPFVDPSLTASQSHQIWILPSNYDALSVVAERSGPTDSCALFVPGLRGIEHILIDVEGRQHVLFRTSGIILQLEIVGADILSEQVILIISPRCIEGLGRAASLMFDLHRILSGSPFPAQPRTARTLNRRDSFIVFDCLMAGRTEREAATIIHGPQAVAQDWRRAAFASGCVATGNARSILYRKDIAIS